jgi:hypothetical protein
MWFKTKIGLVRIEGTVEFFASTYGDGRFAGIFAIQRQHGKKNSKRWFRTSHRDDYDSLYVACFHNDVGVQRGITEAFSLIEAAIRNREAICDLSRVGNDEAWRRPGWSFSAGW